MRAGEGGAPPRASGTVNVARYGAWWRARDTARSARWWLGTGKEMWMRLAGLLYMTIGTFLILVTVIVPNLRQYPAAPCVLGCAFCAIGYACLHEKRRAP